MAPIAGDRRAELCLYCDHTTGSREHIIASGMGGRFVRSDLICGTHNGLCGKWADDPFCSQFAFAVHALEVLQEDNSRGTKWMGLKAQDGTLFDVSPDFRYMMRPKISNVDGAFEIVGTASTDFAKQEKQISATADLSSSFSEIRSYDFASTTFTTHGPGARGILKAALHFVAAIADDRARATEVCRNLADILFSDSIPEIVSPVFYDVTDDRRNVHRLQLLAWNQGYETMVRVKIFNLITYLVRLPLVVVEPSVFEQNTYDGSWTLTRTIVPQRAVDPVQATPEGFRLEFGRRIDAIFALARYKTVVVEILEAAVLERDYRMTVGSNVRAQMLRTIVRNQLRLPTKPTPSWILREAIAFADRRADSMAKNHPADGAKG